MNCPSCNKPTTQEQAADGALSTFCSYCGWGNGARNTFSSEPPPPEKPSLVFIGLLWLVAVVVVIGPYFGLLYGIPELMNVGPEAFDDAAERMIDLVKRNYWWVMGVYLFLALMLSPEPDSRNLGFFGGLADNPFSFEDDWERQKLVFALVLMPGKAVWAAFGMTWRFFTVWS